MFRHIRKQHDGLQQAYSLATALKCTGPDKTRQEFKAETDLATILSKYGVGIPTRPVHYGTETNYDVDLHTAFQLVNAAEKQFNHVDPEVRKQFPTIFQLAHGMRSGELDKFLADRAAAKKAAETPDPAKPAPPQSTEAPPIKKDTP